MSENIDESGNENIVEEENLAQEQDAVQAEESTQEQEQVDENESINAEVVALNEEKQKLQEQVLRVQADMQNVRRRAELDVEKAHKFGLEKFATQLLTVVDNLERTLAAAGEDESTQALRDGVQLTLSEFANTLEKFNIVAINPEGEPFNPELHQAISMIENKEVEPNSVIGVMQKGYSLNGRLLRPAMVMVSKGAPSINEKA